MVHSRRHEIGGRLAVVCRRAAVGGEKPHADMSNPRAHDRIATGGCREASAAARPTPPPADAGREPPDPTTAAAASVNVEIYIY